jgi:hypothetical protein
MPTSTWKGIERAVAELLEGRRVPASGNGAIKGDVIQLRLLPGLIAEVKHGRQVLKAGPKKLTAWLQEAERDSVTAGATGPVLVMHPDGQNIRDSLAILRLGLLSQAQKALVEQRRLLAETLDQQNADVSS